MAKGELVADWATKEDVGVGASDDEDTELEGIAATELLRDELEELVLLWVDEVVMEDTACALVERLEGCVVGC